MSTPTEICAYLNVLENQNRDLFNWNYYHTKHYWTVEYKGKGSVPLCKLYLELDSRFLYIHAFIVKKPVTPECRLAMFYFLLRLNDELPIVKFGLDSYGKVVLMVEAGADQVSLSGFKDLVEAAVVVFGQYYQEVELLAREPELANLLLTQYGEADRTTIKILNKSVNPNSKEGD